MKKSIFEPRPDDARRELLAVPLTDYQASWATLLVPAASILAFDFVVDNFSNLINSLFDLVVAPTIVARGGIGGGASRVGRGRIFGTPVLDFSCCPGSIRSTILKAGRSRCMIQMVYSGYKRLVEPYRLEYYVRKRDGVGKEYFWGWDTTGGRSGKAGIKMFFCDKIESAVLTGKSYIPRYPVEI